MRVLLSTYGSHGNVEPKAGLVGLAVWLRALQARDAAMPMCAPPDFAELLASVGVSLVPAGQPMRPLATMVTGAIPPPLAGEGRDALVTTGVMPAEDSYDDADAR